MHKQHIIELNISLNKSTQETEISIDLNM